MLVLGPIAMGVGAVWTLGGVLMSSLSLESDIAPGLIGGPTLAATGAFTLGYGIRRRRAYNRWHRARQASLPVVVPMRGGAAASWSLRF